MIENLNLCGQYPGGDGKLYPLEIKKIVAADKRLTRAFGIIDKPPLRLGTSAILVHGGQVY